MYQHAAKILPGGIRHKYRDILRYCGIKIDYDRFIGFMILFGLGIALLIAINSVILFSLSSNLFLLVFLLSYLVFECLIYVWMSLSADSKAKFAEKVLPDALQLMAMNIKAGMTTDRALLLAARPEFGPLQKEMGRAGKEILAGKEIKYALLSISTRIRSKLLDRTIRLIVEGIESGGELSDLLQQTAEDIQGTELIEGEVQSNVMMYAIFIFFAAAIGAPLLYGISTYLVEVLGSQFAKYQTGGFEMDDSATQISPFRFGGSIFEKLQSPSQVNISPDFLMLFAVLSLSITSLFGGMIIGIIQSGNEKEGIKFTPILLGVSITIFFLVRIFVSGMFAL